MKNYWCSGPLISDTGDIPYIRCYKIPLVIKFFGVWSRVCRGNQIYIFRTYDKWVNQWYLDFILIDGTLILCLTVSEWFSNCSQILSVPLRALVQHRSTQWSCLEERRSIVCSMRGSLLKLSKWNLTKKSYEEKLRLLLGTFTVSRTYKTLKRMLHTGTWFIWSLLFLLCVFGGLQTRFVTVCDELLTSIWLENINLSAAKACQVSCMWGPAIHCLPYSFWVMSIQIIWNM